ncbi:MAG TPA: radical SAM protein [Clostridia bacterium]|nr:radical SAM protein [Clostridia bacterium]
MEKYQYIFGPLPSRRMGLSLGVSPIPKKCCNYSCVYCQLGRTPKLEKEPRWHFPAADILKEVADYLSSGVHFDVLTVVGEGEPTLYAGLEELLAGLKKLTDKPIAVITNGSLLGDAKVRQALQQADIVMPSLDAYDEHSFKKINRPWKDLRFEEVYRGLVTFSQAYTGQLWLEVMLVRGLNDDETSLLKLKDLLAGIRYDRLFINSPVRPPAESWVGEPEEAVLKRAEEILGGVSIAQAPAPDFYSEEVDDYEAVLSIIKRHPMNQHEIKSFLAGRNCGEPEEVLRRLRENPQVEVIDYKGYQTYRVVR